MVYESGEPVSMYKDRPAAETGLAKDGDFDLRLRTTTGRRRAASPKTFAQDTGLTKDGEAHGATTIGKTIGLPKKEMRAADTGLKKDGIDPDMRTTLGKQIAAERAEKAAKVPIVESSSKSDGALSAESTPQKSPPAPTPPSPAPVGSGMTAARTGDSGSSGGGTRASNLDRYNALQKSPEIAGKGHDHWQAQKSELYHAHKAVTAAPAASTAHGLVFPRFCFKSNGIPAIGRDRHQTHGCMRA